jgi:hypothetical protein
MLKHKGACLKLQILKLLKSLDILKRFGVLDRRTQSHGQSRVAVTRFRGSKIWGLDINILGQLVVRNLTVTLGEAPELNVKEHLKTV